MSSATADSYPAFVISPRVKSFPGYGMGSYCFFGLGVPIESATAFSAPDTPGVQLNDVFTRQAGPTAVAAGPAGQWAIWSARCGSFQPGRTKWQVYPSG